MPQKRKQAIVALEDPIAQAEARLMVAEKALEEAREAFLVASGRYQAAFGICIDWTYYGSSLDCADPGRVAIQRRRDIAYGEYSRLLNEEVPAAKAAVRAAQLAVKEPEQEARRQERRAWLVENDAEYRAILEKVSEYEQQVRATGSSLDQRGNNLRWGYLLIEAIAARDAKLAAVPAAQSRIEDMAMDMHAEIATIDKQYPSPAARINQSLWATDQKAQA